MEVWIKIQNMKSNLKLTSIICVLTVIGIYGSRAQSDSVYTFSVIEAQDYAIENNLKVKNAKLDVIKSEKDVWETTAQGLPQADISGRFTDNLSLRTQLIPNFENPEGPKIPVQFGSEFNASATLEVSQLVFSGPYIVGLQASKVYKQLSQQSLKQTRLNTKANVAKTYYLILLTESNIETLQGNLENLKETLEETKMMAEKGFIESTNVDQVQIQVNNLKNTLNSTKRQKKSYYDMIKIQLGMDLDREIKLTDSLSGIIDRIRLKDQVGQGYDVEKNIQYEMAETQVKLRNLDLKRQKANTLPSLSAFYNYGQDAMRDEFNFFDSDKDWYESSMIGLQLSIPIFAGGSRYSKIQQAQVEVQKAENNRELARKNLQKQLQDSRNTFLTAMDKYYTQQENRKLAKRVFERTNEKFKEGVASSSELTQANDKYLEAESNYISAVVELLNAKIALDKLLNNL